MNSSMLLYDDYDWNGLRPKVKKAASILGYTKDIWNNNGISVIDVHDWIELTAEQRNAALTLGYTQQTWDDAIPEWENLPLEIKQAELELGYTEKIWNDESDVSISYHWDDMTDRLQKVASTLGYTQQTWDADNNATAVDTKNDNSSDGHNDVVANNNSGKGEQDYNHKQVIDGNSDVENKNDNSSTLLPMEMIDDHLDTNVWKDNNGTTTNIY
eukprot:CAMPEP_0171325538 /NCGR_PEP_ID=MMETSP0816-20121228/116868_1 /TAXON_ID=420281 /ORGANISM="Proboscia inermis, Strain CCAP1064/1" /LENGTH=213 /DNA_ID=CAMNT_0011824735 /DNA_START=1523 /DNA_END=2164 /DNA_ORIENTATION=+